MVGAWVKAGLSLVTLIYCVKTLWWTLPIICRLCWVIRAPLATSWVSAGRLVASRYSCLVALRSAQAQERRSQSEAVERLLLGADNARSYLCWGGVWRQCRKQANLPIFGDDTDYCQTNDVIVRHGRPN